MAEDDLSNVVGGPEEIGFKLTFEGTECIRVSDGRREGVPVGRGGDGEGSVPQGAERRRRVGEWRWRRSVMYEGAKLFSAL